MNLFTTAERPAPK